MIILNYYVLIEFALGLLLWWTAIYLFTQNPFNKVTKVAAIFLATISFYFSSDIFLGAINTTGQYHLTAIALRTFIWSMYLPIALIYHASYLLVQENKRKVWQKISLYLVYALTFSMIVLELMTNLVRDYSVFLSSSFKGNLTDATGKYFYLVGIFLILTLLLVALNFYQAMKQEKTKSANWYKYFWPFLGITLSALLGPVVLAGYYNIISYSVLFPIIDFALIILPLTYSIIKYNLFIDEAKVIFGRNFILSTITIFSLISAILIIMFLAGTRIDTVTSLVFPFILIYILIASHPLYDWISTFIKDVAFGSPSGYSVVTDDEIYQAIKNYNAPEKLDESSLLRLKLIDQTVGKASTDAKLNALRQMIKDGIEYFEPDENIHRRTKRNLKYHLLKMIAFDQAEEGQILWELGFEEYPVKILTQENKTRGPLFQITAPSDYSYKSRNAYLALKKEAIHDIVWRISYLEKQASKR